VKTTHQRFLDTRKGNIPFPAYIPVTTFGKRYPLDQLVRPFLPRLAPAIMVSYYYVKQMTLDDHPKLPLLVDSGGFAALFENATISTDHGLGVIELETDEGTDIIHPFSILELQEEVADVAFPLDFPIPPKTPLKEAKHRQKLTVVNSIWALQNRRRRDLPIYGIIQAWDGKSARNCVDAYKEVGFEGLAIGGLVPRARDMNLVVDIISSVRDQAGPDIPIHVFGLGNPKIINAVYSAGADSVDSSSYVRYAADGRLWGEGSFKLENPSLTDRLHLSLCNLAQATGKTLPLSNLNWSFSTCSIRTIDNSDNR
jgi:tRNA-guanine family transglycosylase